MVKFKTDLFAVFFMPLAARVHPAILLIAMTALVHFLGMLKYYLGIVFAIFLVFHSSYVKYKYKSFKYTVFTGPMTILLWSTAVILWQVKTRWPKKSQLWIWACVWLVFAVCLEAYGEKIRTWKRLKVTSKNLAEAATDMLYTIGDLFVDYFRNIAAVASMVYSFYLFLYKAGLPWGIPWIFFVPPIAYIAYRIVYKNQPPRFSFVLFIVVNVVVLAFFPSKTDIVDPLATCTGTNIGICGIDRHVGPPILNQTGCCCMQNTFPWPNQQICSPCNAEAQQQLDCLQRPVNELRLAHVAATGYLCNNQDPSTLPENIFQVGYGCLCAEGTCGETCEIINATFCTAVKLSRLQKICSDIPPGTDSPIVCNQMGSGI